jgi:mycothiol synthase
MTTLTTRPYAGERDLEAVTELLNQVSQAYRLDDSYAEEDLRLEFADPRVDPARDLRLWEDADGRLAAFGQVWLPPDSELVDAFTYWRVHPSAEGSGVEDELFAWGAERIREFARERSRPARMLCSAREHYAYAQEVMRRQGMAPERYFFQMRRPLDQPIEPAELPAGFTLRHVAGPADVAGWVDAYNLSFVDHWNHHPATVETHSHWMQHPSYRPELDLVGVADDGTVAAICFCQIDPAEGERNGHNDGWIDTLGTRRGFRKRGLGRSMLLSGLHRLKAAGAAGARLNVDATNPTGALALYESVGFRTLVTTVAFGKDLSA